MQIRHLVVAILMASATAAHADVIPPASAGFLSGWTAGNGTDVIGSGVLSGSNLIGGIAYSTAASGASAIEALYGKASAALGQNGGTLFLENGIEGQYMTSTGNGIMAAMLGEGVSVVNGANGVTVTRGGTGAATTPSAAPSAAAPAAAPGGSGASANVPADVSMGTSPSRLPETAQLIVPRAEVGPAAPDATAVPEPSTVALMLVGMLGAGAMARRRG